MFLHFMRPVHYIITQYQILHNYENLKLKSQQNEEYKVHNEHF